MTALKTIPGLKRTSRDVRPDGTVVTAGGVEIGGHEIVVMAGPCAMFAVP